MRTISTRYFKRLAGLTELQRCFERVIFIHQIVVTFTGNEQTEKRNRQFPRLTSVQHEVMPLAGTTHSWIILQSPQFNSSLTCSM